MKPYLALLFDLCDTVMPFKNDRMPIARVGRTEVRSTSPLLYACFTRYYTHIPYEQFDDHFVKTTQAVAELRAKAGEGGDPLGRDRPAKAPARALFGGGPSARRFPGPNALYRRSPFQRRRRRKTGRDGCRLDKPGLPPPPEAGPRPDYIITSLADLPPLLEGNAAG